MAKVLVLGASGMLGSMVVDVLSRDPDISVSATVRSEHLLTNARNRIPKIDWRVFDASATDSRDALEVVSGHDWVINAIGITKPLVHDDNSFEVERAIWINSILPHLLGTRAEAVGARVLQIATDCVYSGRKGNYSEKDPHDALDVYGKTKSLGESMQRNVNNLRCSIVGPESKDRKFLLEWFRCQPKDAKVSGYVNHLWNGITTLHFARICKGIIRSNLALPHIQHIVPTSALTKAEMLREFAKGFKRLDVQIANAEAKDVIDRTLATIDPLLNAHIWKAAGYDQPPTVPAMIAELSQYEYRMGDLV